MLPRVTPATADAATPNGLRRVWDSPWPGMALVLLLCCAPLFIGLGGVDLENDEALYSFSVETMLAQGDWLTPKEMPSATEPFLEKPPLKFWLTALPMRAGLLPDNEFGLRFMDALMGSLAFLYVFAIGRRLGGPVCGLASALLLFTHAQLLFQHGLRTNNMEASVVLAYCGGVYHFLAWRSPNPDMKRHIVAMALYFVLGFMTKFVAILFLPMILGAAALLTRPDRARLYRDWRTFAWASLLAVALIAPWFVYQWLLRPQELVQTMFGQHVYQRLTGVLDPAHLHPWSFYLTQLLAELRAAGTIVLTIAGTLLVLGSTVRRRWVEGAVVLLWFAVPVAIISAGTSKLYHYAYPFLPPVALAGGYAVAVVADWLHRWLAAPAAAADRQRARWRPRVFMTPLVKVGTTAIGIAGLALAAATLALDRVRLEIGGVVLRNSSVVRPALAATAVLILGAPMAVLRALVVIAVLLAVMPLAAYQAHLARTVESDHPLRTVRDCLRPLVADAVAAGRPAPGVWVEAPPALPHVYTYYLRDLGPWQHRDFASDGTVAKHLVTPDNYRPVLLSRERYEEVMKRLIEQRGDLFDRVSRMTQQTPEAIEQGARDTVLGIIEFPGMVFLLPGPYSACAAVRTGIGSPPQP